MVKHGGLQKNLKNILGPALILNCNFDGVHGKEPFKIYKQLNDIIFSKNNYTIYFLKRANNKYVFFLQKQWLMKHQQQAATKKLCKIHSKNIKIWSTKKYAFKIKQTQQRQVGKKTNIKLFVL